jgi:thiamine-monophosphate kinase
LTTPGRAAASSLSDLGERGLIERLRSVLPSSSPPLVLGIGDDAAILAPERNRLQVLTTDAVVEGVHFDRRLSTLADAGYRALAVNVSDIAAMGAAPRHALLSLMLPPDTTVEDVDAIADGIASMAREAKVGIAGGNLTRTPGPLTIDVTVAGTVHPRKYLTRAGGRAGHRLYVSGTIGAAAAGLEYLRAVRQDPAGEPGDPEIAACVSRFRRPSPRARLGLLLGRMGAARACMDLSDGLGDAVHQIAEASGTGARLEAAAIPVHPAASRWFAERGRDPLAAAVGAGDDYELLFAVPPRSEGRLRGVCRLTGGLPITRIGELTSAPDVVLVRNGRDEPLPRGFSHF